MKFVITLFFSIVCFSGNVAYAAKSQKPDVTKMAFEETCSPDLARWEIIYQLGKIHEKLEAKDWQGAYDATAPLEGFGATCWEWLTLQRYKSVIFASEGKIDTAVEILDKSLNLKGLKPYQIESISKFKTKLLAGEWQYKSYVERDAQAKADALIGALDRDEYEIKKPSVWKVKRTASSYSGNAMCYVFLDLTEEGKPENLVAKCSFDKFEEAMVEALASVRFSPRYEGGVAVKTKEVMYPFELVMNQ